MGYGGQDIKQPEFYVEPDFHPLEHARAGRTKRKSPFQMTEKVIALKWWEQRESNPRPSACKADALNQLSYAPE